MADAPSDSHGGRRDNAGRKRKHYGSTSSQKTWNSRHNRVYLSLRIYESRKEAKIVGGHRQIDFVHRSRTCSAMGGGGWPLNPRLKRK